MMLMSLPQCFAHSQRRVLSHKLRNNHAMNCLPSRWMHLFLQRATKTQPQLQQQLHLNLHLNLHLLRQLQIQPWMFGCNMHSRRLMSIDSKSSSNIQSPNLPSSLPSSLNSLSKVILPPVKTEQLIKNDISNHRKYLEAQQLDAYSLQSSSTSPHSLSSSSKSLKTESNSTTNVPSHDFESGIVPLDITERMINIREMFDPRIHLPNAPVGWKGFEEATPLSNELIAYMAVRVKPITVADFMRLALTHDNYGYYTNPSKSSSTEFIDDFDDFDDNMHENHDLEVENDYSKNDSPANFIIGKKGDFITAPEVSQVFGECLAIWFVTQHEVLASPSKPIQLVEIGPGKGTLIQDIVRSLCTSFYDKMGSSITSIHLVEASLPMQQEQRQKLEELQLPHTKISFSSDTNELVKDDKSTLDASGTDSQHVISVHWYTSFTDFLEANSKHQIPTFVVCQEFIDALPVHVFEKTQQGWRERMVDIAIENQDAQDDANETICQATEKKKQSHGKPEKKTRLRIVLSPGVSPACKTLLDVDPETGQKDNDDSPVGQVCEVCPEGILLMRDIAKLFQTNGGAALIVDYGQDGSTDSLRGFSRHRQVNFLSRPGLVDVTADVDFGALRHAVNQLVEDITDSNSIFAFGPITQGHFLSSMGIVERVIDVIERDTTTDEQAENLCCALERLILPEHMGERYKVLAIARKKDAIFAPPGFSK